MASVGDESMSPHRPGRQNEARWCSVCREVHDDRQFGAVVVAGVILILLCAAVITAVLLA